MKSLRFLIVVVAALVMLGIFNGPRAAYAADYYIKYTGFAGTCSDTALGGQLFYSNSLPGDSSTIWPGSLVISITGAFPTITVNYSSTAEGGTYSNYQVWGSALPGLPYPYTVTVNKSFVADGVTYSASIAGDCVGAGTLVNLRMSNGNNTIPGPSAPAGFALRTITCDVAVFDAPGGNPVGSNRIKNGQTWYVNPTPAKDSKGQAWTEVFVGGYGNGFVPTKCVR